MNGRDEILRRIRAATNSGAMPETPRNYRGPLGPGDLDLFARRVRDYKAEVGLAAFDNVATAIAVALQSSSMNRVVVPTGFPGEWLAETTVSLASDEPTLSPAELDGISGVITTCAVAIAETGTVVLDHGPGQGRRVLTLVPDYHLVVVRADQVVTGVPDALLALEPTRPQTWISGPSATSDIELNRVDGVHGPRTLEVIIVISPRPSRPTARTSEPGRVSPAVPRDR